MHERDELRNRCELLPDVRRLDVQLVDADGLSDGRVEAVRAHVVQVDPRDVPDLKRRSARQPLCVSPRHTD